MSSSLDDSRKSRSLNGDDETRSEAAGCTITKEDLPSVLASFICMIIFIIYGAAAASLGPALPTLATHYHKSISEMGTTFTVRGVGYMIGTLSSGAFLVKFPNFFLSKQFIASIGVVICGFTFLFIDLINNFNISLVFFFIQGLSFGLVDTVANCALPELWSVKRVQPWMQSVHSCFGIGAIIGPALIGGYGYRFDFYMIFITSMLPLVALVIINLIGYGNSNKVGGGELDSEKTVSEQESKTADGETHRVSPLSFRLLVSFFFFVYVGAESGYAGWIPSYVLLEDITNSESKAAYLSAMFWAALTFGRIVAIPAAIFLSATVMLRIQLLLSVITGLLCVTMLHMSYSIACFVSYFAGFSLAAIFPVMMTIFGDYGYSVDANSTTMFMIGATLGESIVPICIGWLMNGISPFMLPVTVFVSCLLLVVLYLLFHFLSLAERKSFRHNRISATDNDSSVHSNHPLSGKGRYEEGNVYNPVVGSEAFTIEAEDDDEDDDGRREGSYRDEEEGKNSGREVEMIRFQIIDN
jgi:fucose permease